MHIYVCRGREGEERGDEGGAGLGRRVRRKSQKEGGMGKEISGDK